MGNDALLRLLAGRERGPALGAPALPDAWPETEPLDWPASEPLLTAPPDAAPAGPSPL